MSRIARPHREPAPSCLLIYDAECRLCVATKEKLEQAAGRGETGGLSFIPYQCEEAKRALGSLYRYGRPDMAFLVEPSGIVRQGLDAFLPLVSRLPGGALWLKLLRVPYARQLGDWVYRLIARHRYQWFGPARRSS